MARQVGIFLEGTIDHLTFYSFDGKHYVRMKSSLTGKQFCYSRRKAILLLKERKTVLEVQKLLIDYLKDFGVLDVIVPAKLGCHKEVNNSCYIDDGNREKPQRKHCPFPPSLSEVFFSRDTHQDADNWKTKRKHNWLLPRHTLPASGVPKEAMKGAEPSYGMTLAGVSAKNTTGKHLNQLYAL